MIIHHSHQLLDTMFTIFESKGMERNWTPLISWNQQCDITFLLNFSLRLTSYYKYFGKNSVKISLYSCCTYDTTTWIQLQCTLFCAKIWVKNNNICGFPLPAYLCRKISSCWISSFKISKWFCHSLPYL